MNFGGKVAWFLAVVLAASCATAQVVINELLADNETAVSNGGAHPDYVELYNPSNQPVSLAGLSLTDDPTQPRKFVFAAGTAIGALSHVLVWCDTNSIAPGLHTGFALSASGDLVRLYASNGTTVLSEVTFGLQVPDFSLGRVPDGAAAWTLTRPTPLAANEQQELASATHLRINEWMARPFAGEDWIELFNADALPAPLSGLLLTDTPSAAPRNRPIPALSFIGGRGFTQFLASDLAKPDADHLDFKLSADSEILSLYAADRVTLIDRVIYGAQRDNISQGRLPDGSGNIVSFSPGQDTPDEPNYATSIPIVISEILSHTDPPLSDAIELHNPGAVAIDISYWWLSDSSSNPKKYQIPQGTTVPARGFIVIYENQFGAGSQGFTLDSAEGDEVHLSEGDASGALTGAQVFVEFGALKNGVSAGRHPTSVGVDFVPLSQRSFGADNPQSLPEFWQGRGSSNAPARVGPVVISEIHYAPLEPHEEFIELHNPHAQSIPLYDPLYPANRWRLREGVTFDFPENAEVAAHGYLLVVGFDPVADPAKLSAFRTKYLIPEFLPVVGPYEGKLSDIGEGVRLLWPDKPELPPDPRAGFVPYELVERIHYDAHRPWPETGVGSGHSIQRRVALDYGNEPANWFAALPSPGRGGSEDSDRDGMSDSWELDHHLNPQLAADAHIDSDGDGATSLEEYLAGTEPNHAPSVFAFASLILAADAVEVSFNSVAGRTYALQSAEDLAAPLWDTAVHIPARQVSGLQTIRVPFHRQGTRLFRLTTPSPQ